MIYGANEYLLELGCDGEWLTEENNLNIFIEKCRACGDLKNKVSRECHPRDTD